MHNTARFGIIKLLLVSLMIGSFGLVINATIHPDGSGGYMVLPSGDTTGVLDADNIEWALTNTTPGGTVTLMAGHYYASRGIVVEGFDGCLAGAGKDETFLEAVRSNPFPGGGFQFNYVSAYTPGYFPSLLWFEFSTALTVKDLTLEVYDPTPCDEYNVWGTPGTALTHLLADWGGDCDTTITNVRFIGGAGDYNGVNVTAGTHNMRGSYPRDDGVGNITISDCSVENVDTGLLVMWYKDSLIDISDNCLVNMRTSGIWLGWSNTNCSIAVTGNTMMDCEWNGVAVLLAPFSGLSSYVISKNNFQNVVRSIAVFDNKFRFTGERAADLEISGNSIYTETPYWRPGILCYFTEGAVVSNNLIGGVGLRSAISLAGQNNLLKANNVQLFESVLGMPPIWLLEQTQSNTVIGSGNPRWEVLDEGVDNVIKGLK